jgi:hypothetical protein
MAREQIILHFDISDDATGAAREWDSVSGALLALSITYDEGTFPQRYLAKMAELARSRAEAAMKARKPKKVRKVS